MDDWSASVLVPAVALCGTSNYYARPVTGLVDKARPFMDDSRPSFKETRSGSRLNGDSSSSHGVAVAMDDFPLALFVAVHLRGPQRIAALLAVDRC